jgi:ribosome-associated translation inhibitor RaiA
MTDAVSVVIRFKDVENDDEVREVLQRRCDHLAAEFPELTKLELTLGASAARVAAHAHATGKSTDAAASADAPDSRQAGERALEKLERELRRVHDKRIFGRRREAQKAAGKRT